MYTGLLGRGGNTLAKEVRTPNPSLPQFFPAKILM